MQDRAEKRRINRMLANHGLPTMDAPHGLMEVMGRKIEDHGHFRSLLTTCDPKERYAMYEALRPHLRFTSYPLDIYIGQAAAQAEAKQLPTVDEQGNFKAYRPMEFYTYWSTIVKLDLMSKANFEQAMRYLTRDIPEDQLDDVIYKVHIVKKKDTGDDYLRISAGIYVNGEAQRIQ
jgi:hypothetical protein